ncbi:MAG: rhodanese-like domain-containing protein [Deltaproteobacteria bacterium]|nr:rhodanese-like domain-containing protein [Deltaproteobacteria bacterium]
MKKGMSKMLPLSLIIALSGVGCAELQGFREAAVIPAPAAVEQKVAENVYTGKIVGLSDKAKTVSIEVDEGDSAKTVMLKIDDGTTGLKYAVNEAAAIIIYELRGKDRVATVIKPKLAKLPEGVTEIETEEMEQLIGGGTDFLLVDSRPASRYDQSHLPGAVSIPVAVLQEEMANVLPADKNKILVFYCGGVT